MRRMHWWGAATGVGMLAVAAGAAPAAYASHAKPTSLATHVGKPGTVPARTPGSGGQHGHHRPPCPYPPHGAADVSISGRDHVHLNQALVITGAMKVNGCGYGHFIAGLYKLLTHQQHRPDEWVKLQTGATGAGGAISFTLTPTSSEVYRIMTAPGDGLSEGVSRPLRVEYRAFPH
ncbi:MAG TPA: hypothetical protein VI248_03450 [Kineosporiaceae bacterium]